MLEGIHIDFNLNLEIGPCGVNARVPTGVTIDKKFDTSLRLIEIPKGFDTFNFFSDQYKDRFTLNFKKLLGDDLSKYKFLISFYREEASTTKDKINFFTNLFKDGKILFITTNIEEYQENKVLFLNNSEWIYDDVYVRNFFDFWKYLKRQDIGTIKKKYMFLINHYSDIRFEILKFLYKNNKQNEGNISFNLIDFEGCKLDKSKILSEINEFNIDYPSYYDTYPTLSHLTDDVRFQKTLIGINHVGTLPHFNYRIYLESYFEIITETAPHLVMEGTHISEKIHKPLRTALPFMYYGKPEVKVFLESIGMSFTSPIYFFGLNEEEYLNHLNFLLNQDFNWYNSIQIKYLDEYFNNMDIWIKFIKTNNDQLLKFMYP